MSVFDDTARTRFLDEVTAGQTIGDAAKTVGIDRRLPTYHARRDEQFARALADAKARGKQARNAKKDHDESRYNHLGCRCPRCTATASAARAGRRHTADTNTGEEAPPIAAVLAVQAAAAGSSPTSFPLRGSSSSPTRAAA